MSMLPRHSVQRRHARIHAVSGRKTTQSEPRRIKCSANPNSRPPFPPFDAESAAKKVRMAEDAWNTRNPERVSLAYTPDSIWRNRSEFLSGREAIVQFLRGSGTRSWIIVSSRSFGLSKAVSPCALPTSGTTTRVTGSAPTATRTGSSTSMASCGAHCQHQRPPDQ